ncbi:aminoacyl-tRNA hydrolase [Ureaplasma canigenitalium]|uniref:aminoacyl-tRNA hydrolase n=1 Tax=Ureaplasma canigenitalium TaxID=42092 RepID=UPI0004E1861B|nr:aminoacyl-tRNA hydrolase [Ureaplasma canigenitalium]
MEKYLIVGLGNPGSNYSKTKHNVGFMVIDELLEALNLKLTETKFNGAFTKTFLKDKIVYIAKPMTFMNLSGEFVSAFIRYFDINTKNIIVVYDDIDTVFGSFKLRYKGSSGGQNGMKNIINLIGTDEIKRVRVGIGRNKNMELSSYVLSSFSIQERLDLIPIIKEISKALIDAVGEDFDKVMNKYNR